MTIMKPCPKCHSTKHLHIEMFDDYRTLNRSAKAECTECNIFAQVDYVFMGTSADEYIPDAVQLTREVIERWNECCDDWEGIFNDK